MASGCLDEFDLEPEEGEDDYQTPDPEKGLEVTTFESTDTSLNIGDEGEEEGQRAEIDLVLTNYHTHSVEIEDLHIANTGFLEVSEPDCGSLRIERAFADQAPQTQCNWEIHAPTEDEVGQHGLVGTEEITLYFEYDATFTNFDPINIDFEQPDQITNVNEIQRSFENEEVQLLVETMDTAPVGETEDIDIMVRELDGAGRIIGDVEFEYEPESVFENCEDDLGQEVPGEVQQTCQIQDDIINTRPLYISAHYKYEQSQNLPIELVS